MATNTQKLESNQYKNAYNQGLKAGLSKAEARDFAHFRAGKLQDEKREDHKKETRTSNYYLSLALDKGKLEKYREQHPETAIKALTKAQKELEYYQEATPEFSQVKPEEKQAWLHKRALEILQKEMPKDTYVEIGRIRQDKKPVYTYEAGMPTVYGVGNKLVGKHIRGWMDKRAQNVEKKYVKAKENMIGKLYTKEEQEKKGITNKTSGLRIMGKSAKTKIKNTAKKKGGMWDMFQGIWKKRGTGEF